MKIIQMIIVCKAKNLTKEIERQNRKVDNIHRIFCWHIITLAKLNYRLKELKLKGGKQYGI
ncbi:MAG: hypothetical protein HFJ48_06285 [Clostridia bacterium]|nr:hypothetical protein [Clostridia bacterium]